MAKRVEVEEVNNGFVITMEPGNTLCEQKKVASDFAQLVDILRAHFKNPLKDLKDKPKKTDCKKSYFDQFES